MKKADVRAPELKISKWLFLAFIFFLIVTTPTKQQVDVDETSQFDDASSTELFSDAERLPYAPIGSYLGGKALSGQFLESEIPYGNHGPFIVSLDANNRDAVSVDEIELIGGYAIFSFYKNITLDHTQFTADLIDFPILLDLYDKDLQDDTQPDGDDILFRSSSGVYLDHEIEYYNPNFNTTHAHLVAWVRTNVSASSDTVISMYYGNPTVGSQENPEGVWINNYVGVWHLQESPTGASGEIADSTSNNNDGTTVGSMNIADSIAAIIGKGLELDGLNDMIVIPDSLSLDSINDEGTLHLWINWDNAADGGYQRVMTSSNRFAGGGGPDGFEWASQPGGDHFFYPWGGDSNNYNLCPNPFTNTQWHHLVVTLKYSTKEVIIYVDGSPKSFTTENVPTYWTQLASLDDWQWGGNSDLPESCLAGKFDEIRVSDVVRSAAWILTEYDNQNDPTSFIKSVGSEQVVGGTPPSYEGYDLIGFNDGSIFRGGMAFPLNVPKGVTIEEAYLSLHAADASGSAQQVLISVYDVTSVPIFGHQKHTNGLMGHAQTWTTTVSWSPPSAAAWNGWESTPSLTSLVQHIVDRSDWQAGNYIGFVIDGGSSGNWWRAWHHYGNLPGPGYAPKLTIRYTYPSWWNSNYGKRIPINVTNNADVALPAGYSVSFSINTWYLNQNGLLRADGNDLRIAYFNASSGSWTELTRYNETAFNTYKTQMWFKTQTSIPTNSYDINYYMYYDNPSAINPPKNPANIFLFFDDFNDGNTYGWTPREGYWFVQEYPASSGNYVVRGANNAYLYKQTGSFGDVAISARIRWEGGSRYRGVSVRYYEGWQDNPNSVPASYRIRMNAYDNATQLRRRPNNDQLNSTWKVGYNDGANYDPGDWYRYEVAAQTVNTDDVFVRGRIYDVNMTLRTELTYLDTSSLAIYANGRIALYGQGWFDDVIVRNFVNPEPTVSLNSPLGIHLMMLTMDSTDFSQLSGGEGWEYNNEPFYNHIVQDFGYVVDHHGEENKEYNDSPFYIDGLHFRYDAILVSPTISSPTAISLCDEAIPVLTWEEYNNDELNLGSSPGNPLIWDDEIYVVNNNHYITSGQALDWVSIYSGPQNMGWIGDYDPLPPGCEIVLLATNNSASYGQLIALEKGAVDYYPPHTAPERRVFWPGQRGDVLNTAGWTLFDRALNWTLYIDQQPPVIQDYGHTYYGNGTAVFYADVTDTLESVTSVYLNYKVDGMSQTPVSLQWNESHWVWSNTFAWNTEIQYTILNATDSQGNVNSSLSYVWDFQHRFIVDDQVAPSIQSGGYEALPSEDGLLRFWFTATDEGLGLNLNSGSVNITIENNSTWATYPMMYNTSGYFTTDVQLAYWYNVEVDQMEFSYNFTVSDLTSLSATGGGDFNQLVPDVVDPNLGDYGVMYEYVGDDIATIWNTAYDRPYGSGIDTSPPGVYVNYSIQGVTSYYQQMTWNGSHWVYNAAGIQSQYWFDYWFKATDRAGRSTDNSGNPAYFDPQDTQEPTIHSYGHEYFGNGTTHFYADVSDNYEVERVDLNYTISGVPQPIVSMQYNGTLWVWNQYFAWNQPLSPYAVNYTIARAKDGSGNENVTLANVWDPQHSFMTEDWFLPVVEDSNFDALPDYDGHLRFWVDLSDYSGIDPNTVFLNLTLPSGQPDYQMSHNGTFYTVELNLPYWWSEPTRTTFAYTFTASDLVQQSTTAGGASGENVPDIVAPSVSSHGVEMHPAGQATIWILAVDGINGSGVDPNEVFIDYSIVGVGGPWTYPMPFNGTHWIYVNSSLTHGDEIRYSVNVTDKAGNTFLSISWTKFYFDEFPPTIGNYGYSQDGKGNVQFWADVTDDQSPVSSVRCQFWLSSLGSPNASRTMTNTSLTHWESDFISFVWNTMGYYTIPQAMDLYGNVNTSLNGVWVKSFVAEDWDPPTISTSGYNNLTDRDGHLEFWVEPDDTYSGIDPNHVYLNLTLSGSSPQLYPMPYDIEDDRYEIDRDLPYWTGITQTQFDYSFVVYDQAGNSYSGGGQLNRYVSDIVDPVVSHANGHGGYYVSSGPQQGITIWSTAYDGVNGSGLYFPSSPPYSYEGVFLNYSLVDPVVGPFFLVQMSYNGSHWTYRFPGTYPQGYKIYYAVNATDNAGNNRISSYWLYSVDDFDPPEIVSRSAQDYGNGTIKFSANVTDASEIQFVELNYTFSGVPYLQNMTYNGTSGYYEYTSSYIPWDTEVLYTITRAADIANNVNTTLATNFQSLTTVDLEDPVISASGFDAVPDVDGHLRFWAIISDSYSGLNSSNLSIDISSPGVSGTFLLTDNGTFYTYETNIAYWDNPYTVRMSVTYTVTASDNAGRSASPSGGGPTDVPEVVPPELDDYAGVEEIPVNSARFWCTPLDGINGSQVRSYTGSLADVTLYYAIGSPSSYTPVSMEDNTTHWRTVTISGFSFGNIIYYYVNASDGAGNYIDNAATPWTHLYGDTEDPTIVTYGYDYLSDEDGHLRFWANATDNGAIKNVTLDLFIIDTSTALSIGMPSNGSYYTASPYLTCSHTFNYNITAYDTALLTDKTSEVTGQTVQDIVAPKILDIGILDNLNGTIIIWIETRDGVNGTGFPPANDTVLLYYLKNGFGPFQRQMLWNGSGNFYTYSIENLHAGDILDYYIRVEDVALNSRTTVMYKYGVADQTPPTIYGSGHKYKEDEDGHIRFYISVTEDIGVISQIKVEGNVSGNPTPFSNTMTAVNDTYYIYDMYVAYGRTISYNITVWNVAGLSSQTSLVSDQVQDVVAPQSQKFSVNGKDNQDGTVRFRVSVTDGTYGSGINPNNVYIIYRVGEGDEKIGKMKSTGGSNYDYTISNLLVGHVINYYVRATDNAGNTGEGPRKIFGVSDTTDPQINKIGYEYLNDSDGHIRFWCNATDPFGTIQKATVKITGDHEEKGIMIWMGTKEYYYDTYLPYGNSFNFVITVWDTGQNYDTADKSGHTVQDTVPPRIWAADGEEFQNGTAILWANVTDGAFGSGFPSARNTVNITFQLNERFPQTIPMDWNPSEARYEHVVNNLKVADVLDFFIQATDNAGNTNTGTIKAYKFAIPDKTSPQIHTCGYSLLPEDDGLVQFWVNASDPFGTIDKVLLNITIHETAVTGKSATVSLAMESMITREMGRLNATHWAYEENLGYQVVFSYTIIAIDGGENPSETRGESEQFVGDGAPPRVSNADIIDPGNGKLTIWAEVIEKGTGIASLEVVYSVDGATWERVPMTEYNRTHYVATVEIKAGNPIYWRIATKDLGGNVAEQAYDTWAITPYPTQKVFPLIYLVLIIAAVAVTAVIAIKRFRKVVGLDKERVMNVANQMTDAEVIARLDDHTYGVVLSFFDQREGPIPSIVTPVILDDHIQFLVDLSDRSFSAGGFVEEVTEEKVTIFDTRLAESRMVCYSYGFALENPEARGGKENMTINLLIDPIYGELTNIFSPEILPLVREIRSLIINQAPRENVTSQMEKLRSLVTRIIAAYQNLYGEEAFIQKGGEVSIMET